MQDSEPAVKVIIVDTRPKWLRYVSVTLTLIMLAGAIAEVANWLNIHP